MSATLSTDEIVKRIQGRIAEQNEVIREQQVQIQEQQAKIIDLEQKLEALQSADSERNELISKLSELIE